MQCFDDYITISENVGASRSGLYATDLPGIDTELLTGIARSTSDDYDDIWETIYKRATRGLVSDVGKNLQDKFFVDLKLVSRETSKFKDDFNTGSSLAGVTIEFDLPKYAKVHIISVGVYSQSDYSAGQGQIKIYEDDADGELLKTVSKALITGKNTINVDSDFEADKLFIAYDPSALSFRQTENKQYATPYDYFDSVTCDFCFYDGLIRGSVTQVNGGGLNVKYIIYCSAEKFVCENIKLFEDALLYKIGQEITRERRLGERLNQYTVMTKERWDELYNDYTAQYQQHIMNTLGSVNIPEDRVCYACKNTVRIETRLP
jgi:hypothetical protein